MLAATLRQVFPLIFLCTASIAAAQHHHAQESEAEQQVGAVSFPTSCSPSVQAPFERGVALLHSFEYNNADKQFKDVEQKDPSCAMAYWGDAMTFYHQLWDRPSKSAMEAGRNAVQKAQAIGVKTERERGYIEAAAEFFENDDKKTYENRAAGYLHALEKLHERYPDDHEAAIFYALSLIASPQANDNDFAYRKKAGAILETLLASEPNHPGISHYLIHACDNPEMAKQGLAAARRYAQIAPASPHALHMPSHIFARLGLWQDDIQSNLASKAAAEKQSQTASRLHAMDFLEYAYLQIGQDEKARAIEAEALQVPKQDFEAEMAPFFYYVQVHFPALLTLETRAWKDAGLLRFPADAAPDFQAVTYWAQAVAAGHLKDIAGAKKAVAKYDQALEAVKKSSYAYVADEMTTSRDEAHAWLAFAEGDAAKAIQLLTHVADEQDKVGKGEVDLPAREMLADMLLEVNRPQESLAQYTLSLKTDPNRFNGLYGAAQAAELCHRPGVANGYYKQLLANCDYGAGSDRAELVHAKAQVKNAAAGG